MSGTDYTKTPNYGLYKPISNADINGWGGHLNANADTIDSALHGFLPLSGGTITGTINLWPPGNGQVNIGVNQNFTGAAETAFLTNINSVGSITDNSTVQLIATAITDSVNATGAQGSGLSHVRYGINLAAGAVGGRTAFGAHLSQIGATTSQVGQYYVAGAFWADANSPAGGTSSAVAGALFASNDYAVLKAGAGPYWEGVQGYELDIGAEAGTGLAYKGGMSVVLWATDRVAGSAGADYGYTIAAQATCAGLDRGYAIGSYSGWWPMKTTSTLIGTIAPYAGGPAYAAAWGVDFSGVAFSGGLIRGPGYSVDGNGRVSPLLSNATNDAAAATAGVPIGAMYRNGNAVQVRLT